MKSSSRRWGSHLLFVILIVLNLLGTSGNIRAQKVSGSSNDLAVDTLIPPQLKMRKDKAHSPHKATFYSAILPGLGQAYNKKYWKIPILYAGIGAMGYAIHFNSTYYQKYKNAYRDFLIGDPGNKSYLEVIPATLTEEDIEGQYSDWFETALENKKTYFKRYRDLSYIGMVGIYLLNLVDATVDAHFYNFDVSDDLSMQIRPVMMNSSPVFGNQLGLKLSLRF
jgi:hypothetical protein